MNRLYLVGLSLCAALLFTALVLFGYQQQAAAQVTTPTQQTTDETETDADAEGEIVAITPVRLDGQIVLSVTVRVGEDLTVTTPITLDVASWIADLEGSTEITAGVAVGEPSTVVTGAMSAMLTPTVTSTVDVTITGLITPVLSLVELLDEELDEEEMEEEPVLRGEVLFPSNLREGPSTDTPVIGNAQPGAIVVIVDTNAAGDWYLLEGGEWIAGFLVQLLEPETPEALDEADESNDVESNDIESNDAEEADEDATLPEDEEAEEDTLMPVPTAMPAEEDDNAGAAGEDDYEYRVSVITGLLNLASGLEAIGNLMEDPQILSSGWNDSIAAQAAVIRGSYEQIAALTPPEDAASFHADLLSAVGDCDVAMDLLTNGLDGLDMDALDSAANLMVQCGGKMELVMEDYPEFLE